MTDVMATWSISLDTECPECEHDFDIIEDDCDSLEGVKTLETNRTVEVMCPKCEHEFTVKLEY